MKNKPNILFIMADDHAAKAISSYGGGINNTPNIDRIANEGVKFDRMVGTLLASNYNSINFKFFLILAPDFRTQA